MTKQNHSSNLNTTASKLSVVQTSMNTEVPKVSTNILEKPQSQKPLLAKIAQTFEINLSAILGIIVTIIRFVKSIARELWVTPSIKSILVNMLLAVAFAKITVALSYAIGVSPVILIVAKEYLKIWTDVSGHIQQTIGTVVAYYKELNATSTENIILKTKIEQLLALITENDKDKKELQNELSELRNRVAQTEQLNTHLSTTNTRIMEQLSSERLVTTQDKILRWTSSILAFSNALVSGISIYQKGWNIFTEVPSAEIFQSVKAILTMLRAMQTTNIRATADARERGTEHPLTRSSDNLEDFADHIG